MAFQLKADHRWTWYWSWTFQYSLSGLVSSPLIRLRFMVLYKFVFDLIWYRDTASWSAPRSITPDPSHRISQHNHIESPCTAHRVYVAQQIPRFTCLRLQSLAHPAQLHHRENDWMTVMDLSSMQLQSCSHLSPGMAVYHISRWPSYTILTCLTWRCICIPNMYFLGRGFRSWERHRHTDRCERTH